MATLDELKLKAAQLRQNNLEKTRRFILDYMIDGKLEQEIITAISHGSSTLMFVMPRNAAPVLGEYKPTPIPHGSVSIEELQEMFQKDGILAAEFRHRFNEQFTLIITHSVYISWAEDKK
jgi:hypothetical protein